MNIYTINLLIKRELYERRQSLIWLSIFSGLILFFIFQKQLYFTNMEEMQGFVGFLFISIGAYFSGFAFREFGSVAKMRNYLLIPASNFEKIIAKILFYVFGWWVLFILIWLVAGIAANIVFGVFMGKVFTFSNMLNSLFSIITIILPWVPAVFLVQSLGVFASCYFKKSAWLKLTVAILLITLLVIALLTVEIALLVKFTDLANMSNLTLKNPAFIHMLNYIVNPLYLIIGLAACGLSYLALRETEAY